MEGVGLWYGRGILAIALLLFLSNAGQGQNGILRGNVVESGSGDPIAYATIQAVDADKGSISDEEGFFILGALPPGKQRIRFSFLGYQDTTLAVEVPSGKTIFQRVVLSRIPVELQAVEISGVRERARSEVGIGQIRLSRDRIKTLPAVGAETDLAQFLSTLPGVVLTGDQGGQLFIRGGSPVQNRVLLDGQLVFNPFHTIGLFSVFETEIIRSADVLSAGFNAEHGGRISAVMDIKTRDGNRDRWSGLVSVSPFQGKFLLEGPLLPRKKGKSMGPSFLITGKKGWIDRTSPHLYRYAVDSNRYAFAAKDTSLNVLRNLGLPYQYTDLYGKISLSGENGSRLNLFGFSFSDRFSLANVARQTWDNRGGGMYFLLSPLQSTLRIEGNLGFSTYRISLDEKLAGPRSSGLDSYQARLDFLQSAGRNVLEYGVELLGVNTTFQFVNPFRLTISQRDFTTEIAGFVRTRWVVSQWIVEPGFRVHYYASQGQMSPEPRLGIKYLFHPRVRIKAGGGWYSQNLISLANNQDVTQLFTAFLVGPQSGLFEEGNPSPLASRLQRARHIVLGLEWEPLPLLSLSAEAYRKDFTRLIVLNRNKRMPRDPDFLAQGGEANGIDLSVHWKPRDLDFNLTYSLASVEDFQHGTSVPTVFDRRHSLNGLISWQFGTKKAWKLAAHGYLGSGFPFTQTQGFFEDNRLPDRMETNIPRGNFPLGTLLSETVNGGRLSWYHRLDASLQYTRKMANDAFLEITGSVVNTYNRKNIFYVDRISRQSVFQLPIMPALNMTMGF